MVILLLLLLFSLLFSRIFYITEISCRNFLKSIAFVRLELASKIVFSLFFFWFGFFLKWIFFLPVGDRLEMMDRQLSRVELGQTLMEYFDKFNEVSLHNDGSGHSTVFRNRMLLSADNDSSLHRVFSLLYIKITLLPLSPPPFSLSFESYLTIHTLFLLKYKIGLWLFISIVK